MIRTQTLCIYSELRSLILPSSLLALCVCDYELRWGMVCNVKLQQRLQLRLIWAKIVIKFMILKKRGKGIVET